MVEEELSTHEEKGNVMEDPAQEEEPYGAFVMVFDFWCVKITFFRVKILQISRTWALCKRRVEEYFFETGIFEIGQMKAF